MHGLLAAGGIPITVINDSPGFISQRILAMIVNIAANNRPAPHRQRAGHRGRRDPGPGISARPAVLGDKVRRGKDRRDTDYLFKLTGRPALPSKPWLRRRVECGVSLLTEEVERN